MSHAKIRIVVADDQALFAAMLKTTLETRADDFEVVGIAHDGQEALALVAASNPDVVLLDVRMPVMDGVQTAKQLVKQEPRPQIIMLTTFDDNRAVQDVLGLGVSGYILKDCDPEELFAAIRVVKAGGTTLSPTVVKTLLRTDRPLLTTKFPALTRREREILLLIADGLENIEIAERLFIAEQTVKNNMSSLYSKLEVKDRAKLVKLAEEFARTLSGDER